MKRKTLVAMISLLAGVALVALTVPPLRAEAHWLWVVQQDTPQGYAAYLAAWPGSRHAPAAEQAHDAKVWRNATTANTVEAFEQYLRTHPQGQHAAQARDKIDDFHWQHASTADTLQALERYLSSHPEGKYVTQARDRIDDFH